MAKAKGKRKEADKGAPAQATPQVHMTLPEGIKAKRSVILPTLNLQVGSPRIMRIDAALHVSTYKDPDPKKAEKPATIAPVTDIQTGEQFQMLFPAVLESSLKEGYSDDGYVGLTFYMEKLAKRPGKRYFDFKLVEVDASDFKA